jgi:hypothetical protein
MTRLPGIDEETVECGSFRLYTNGSGEVILHRGRTHLRISPGNGPGEIIITGNAPLSAAFTSNLPAIVCRKD